MPLGKSICNNLGDKVGNSNITLSTNQLPSHNHTGTTNSEGLHNHTASDSGHNHSYNDAYFAENRNGRQYVYANISVGNNGAHTHAFTKDATGSGSSVNIMNPYLVLNYLIKYYYSQFIIILYNYKLILSYYLESGKTIQYRLRQIFIAYSIIVWNFLAFK
jgi:microcystin-dependent protein